MGTTPIGTHLPGRKDSDVETNISINLSGIKKISFELSGINQWSDYFAPKLKNGNETIQNIANGSYELTDFSKYTTGTLTIHLYIFANSSGSLTVSNLIVCN